MLGKLKDLGFGPDRVVPVAFHVDYFDKPWKDRFSHPDHSRREMAYNTALKRDDLYFTPMLMIDGRYPMLGSDQPKAVAALKRTTSAPPGVSLTATLKAAGGKDASPSDVKSRELRVHVGPPAAGLAGREVMVGVAVTEDPVTTDVRAGENQGKTLVERHAVRKFLWQRYRFERARPRDLNFTLDPGEGFDPNRCAVAVWVQDWDDGRVHQAERLRWSDDARPSAAPASKP